MPPIFNRKPQHRHLKRMRNTAVIVTVVVASLCQCLIKPPRAADLSSTDSAQFNGSWRFTHALPAPWQEAVGDQSLIGKTLTVGANRLRGPAPFDCGHMRVETTAMPAESLFQGMLPVPAERAAEPLGIHVFPVISFALSCDTGVFDFHLADAHTLLVALDNRIWTLSRAPGALAAGATPEGTVERLLEAHFNGDMDFITAAVENKNPWLANELLSLIADYFSRPQPPDEVPNIDGDPFTDSQEYPTRFAVGKARRNGRTATVPVTMADAWRTRTLEYKLRRESGGWRLDDIVYPEGGSLRALLR